MTMILCPWTILILACLSPAGQLRDYEWQLDQEADKFHKIDEKRKNINKDMQRGAARRGSIQPLAFPQSHAARRGSVQPPAFPQSHAEGQGQAGALHMSFDDWKQKKTDGRRASLVLPPGGNKRKMRVIDPSKGPVNPMAVQLPSLHET